MLFKLNPGSGTWKKERGQTANHNNLGGALHSLPLPRPSSTLCDSAAPNDSLVGAEQAVPVHTASASDDLRNVMPSTGFQSDPLPEIHGPLSTSLETSRNEQLLRTLDSVLHNVEKRNALLELKDERAQLMIDFLDFVLLQPNISIAAQLRKHTTIVLYRLCKSTNLYPQCYVQKGIEIDAREDGGAFSDVFRGHKGGKILCVKLVRTQQKSDTDAVLRVYAKEAILWGQLDHPNIAPFYGVYYLNGAREQVCLVSLWMNNGNIVKYLKNNRDVPREPLVSDIALGLEYLHSQNLVHSDLKGMNILINDVGRACITDFGLSFLRSDQTLTYAIGASTVRGCTYRWAAPELVEEEGVRPTLASDIWAFGCVCFEVLTGSPPFPECQEDPGIILRLSRHQLPSGSKPAEVLAGVDEYMCKLMNRCWKVNPKERPSCQEILEELKSKGLAREAAGEAQGSMGNHKQHFRAALGENMDMSVDLTEVARIFDEL